MLAATLLLCVMMSTGVCDDDETHIPTRTIFCTFFPLSVEIELMA